MAKDELKTIKFQMMLSPTEAKVIDDWGFENRIRSRAEAIRRLCQMAMAQEEHLDLVRGQLLQILDQHLETFKDRLTALIDSKDESAFVKSSVEYERELSQRLVGMLKQVHEMGQEMEALAGREAGDDMAKDALLHKIKIMNTVISDADLDD